MVRIGLISDTHGFIDDRILDHLDGCDEIWHAGDIGSQHVSDTLAKHKSFKAVYGNIDDHIIQNLYPENLVFQVEQLKVWITHIGGKPPGYNKRIKSHLRSIQPDLFICGHSHLLRIIPDHNLKLLYINPGAAGHQGFHKIRTMIRFTIDGSQIKDLQVIELGKRGILQQQKH